MYKTLTICVLLAVFVSCAPKFTVHVQYDSMNRPVQFQGTGTRFDMTFDNGTVSGVSTINDTTKPFSITDFLKTVFGLGKEVATSGALQYEINPSDTKQTTVLPAEE